jgi:hypothetical protein
VEEGKHVEHLFELLFGAIVEDLVAQLGVVLLDVLTKTIWGLGDDLKRFLQDSKWELLCWSGGQPKSECWIWPRDVLEDDLKSFEPGSEQMAVLEHNPLSFIGTVLNVLFGLFSHSLSEGQELELVESKADRLDELLDIAERISSRTKDKHDWCLA